jgi:hypothetical protein
VVLKYLAIITGGIGSSAWEEEIVVEGNYMSFADAFYEVEKKIEDDVSLHDGEIVSIELLEEDT